MVHQESLTDELEGENADCVENDSQHQECTERRAAAKSGFIAAAAALPWDITIFLNPYSLMCNDFAISEIVDAMSDHEIAFFSHPTFDQTSISNRLQMFEKSSYPYMRCAPMLPSCSLVFTSMAERRQ